MTRSRGHDSPELAAIEVPRRDPLGSFTSAGAITWRGRYGANRLSAPTVSNSLASVGEAGI